MPVVLTVHVLSILVNFLKVGLERHFQSCFSTSIE
jgi:hypothetical protein